MCLFFLKFFLVFFFGFFFLPLECEHLIRRMLQLDPSKRIPLASVLRHRWMDGVEVRMETPAARPQTSSPGEDGSMVWNEEVLQAIKNMNYNVFTCQQVSSAHVLVVETQTLPVHLV